MVHEPRIIPLKEQFDEQVIDSALKSVIQNKSENMETHIIYDGHYYFYNKIAKISNLKDRLRSFILEGMKKYNIKKLMITCFHMFRINLATKEEVEKTCKGKLYEKGSVNDDLESLIDNINFGKDANGVSKTNFFPKLTKKELKLVERKDYNFMYTFNYEMYADVKKADMEASASNSKYVWAWGERRTFTLQNN